MRYTGPKNRIARREGMDLGLKTPGSKAQAQLLKKMNILPGQHGIKGRRKSSEHAQQLREKQKLKSMYGLTETTMKNYFKVASKRRGNTALYLTESLESRLDNVVYRLGFAPTRAAARQLISHNHVMVNNKIMSIASYRVRINDQITFANPNSTKIPYIEKSLTNEDLTIPEWVEKKGPAGKLVALPTVTELEKIVNLRLVIEFYSR